MVQIRTMKVGSSRNVAVSFSGMLDDGELLILTPTVTSTGITIANEAINTAEIDIEDVATPIAEAVQFSVSGGTAGTDYPITITVSTDAAIAQTLVEIIELQVR